MKELETRIIQDGKIINNEILKIDSFINHQIDVNLLNNISKYLASHFDNITKILTIETSGIAFAIGVSQCLGNIPVVFAKKTKSKIVDEKNIYTARVHSFTKNVDNVISVDKRFLSNNDNILIVDDSKLNREILSSILKNAYNIIDWSTFEEVAKRINYDSNCPIQVIDPSLRINLKCGSFLYRTRNINGIECWGTAKRENSLIFKNMIDVSDILNDDLNAYKQYCIFKDYEEDK